MVHPLIWSLRNPDTNDLLKTSPVLNSVLYGSWPSITVLPCSCNEAVGLFPSATDWFLQRFNHSFQVLSWLLALLQPLSSWSFWNFFCSAHSKWCHTCPCRERGCEWFSLDVVTFPQLLRALCAAWCWNKFMDLWTMLCLLDCFRRWSLTCL